MIGSLVESIQKPTLLLDEFRCRANIRLMVEKATLSRARFRPHFKTHQSAQIGKWFREYGVSAITVSSVDMACYFADHGWRDITIAFTVNLRQVEQIDALAARIHLELLVESPETIEVLHRRLKNPVDVWIKVDVGTQRTGIPVGQVERVLKLARLVGEGGQLDFRGVLTHAGHFYHASSPAEIQKLYAGVYDGLNRLRAALHTGGFPQAEISYGDTPACTLVENLHGLDEIRPGNFVFYDAMQYGMGVCQEEQIAVGLACPVVAKHPERDTVIVYGGAIHLSKDCMEYNGQVIYGLVTLPAETGWGKILPGVAVTGLSQEHGMIKMDTDTMKRVQVGDLLFVLPVHSCLTVDLMQRYYTLDGQPIDTLGKGYL